MQQCKNSSMQKSAFMSQKNFQISQFFNFPPPSRKYFVLESDKKRRTHELYKECEKEMWYEGQRREIAWVAGQIEKAATIISWRDTNKNQPDDHFIISRTLSEYQNKFCDNFCRRQWRHEYFSLENSRRWNFCSLRKKYN